MGAALVVFQVDSSLSFLDEYVSEALAAGAAPYKPPHQRQEELARTKGKTRCKKQHKKVTEKKKKTHFRRRQIWPPRLFVCFLTATSSAALSLEPYGLSLPISMSSCSIADRHSPTLLSISSGLSGNSADLSNKGG